MRLGARLGAGGCLAIVSLALLLVVPSTGATLAIYPDQAFSSYNTGAVQVVLPDALPSVNLSQDANTSVAASLTMAKVVELSGATGLAAAPTIVAAAFESDVRTFNGTPGPDGGVVARLTANLTVYRDDRLLFPPANSTLPFHPLTPIAPTTIEVTVTTTASDSVVNVSATVSHWPWVDSNDLLAVAWEFDVSGGSGFAGCQGPAHPLSVPSTPCGVNGFAFGNSTWGWSGFDGVQGLTGAGPSAQLRWPTTVTLATGPGVPTIAGAEREGPTSLEVVTGGASYGSPSTTFGLSYALVVPASLPALLHGAIVPFAGGVVAAAGAGLAAVYLVRRRDRRLLESL